MCQAPVWRSEGNSQDSVLSLHHGRSGIKLGSSGLAEGAGLSAGYLPGLMLPLFSDCDYQEALGVSWVGFASEKIKRGATSSAP